MIKNSNKRVFLGISGDKCPHCNQNLFLFGHKELTEKLLSQPYYFSKWGKCDNCGHIQHYEKYKVFKGESPIQEGSDLQRKLF